MSNQITSTTESEDGVIGTTIEDAKPETVESMASASADKSADESSEVSEASNELSNEAGETEELDASEDGKDGDDAKPLKKGGVQKRIDKLTKRAFESEREANYWKAEALKGQAPAAMPKTETTPVLDATKPNPEHYETQVEYVEALAEYKLEQKLAERDQASRQLSEKAAYEARLQANRDKAAEFSKAHADFKEVIEDVSDIVLSPVIQDAILDNGPEFMYELSKNREELERINALSPSAAQRALGRLEERIATKKSAPAEPKLTTKAPPPIKAVGSSSSGLGRKSYEDMDADEYMAARKAEARAARV